MVILGGLGNIWGVIAGGLLLGFVDRSLRLDPGCIHGIGEALNNQACSSWTWPLAQLIFGIALVVMMLVRPEGLFPSARGRPSCTPRRRTRASSSRSARRSWTSNDDRQTSSRRAR